MLPDPKAIIFDWDNTLVDTWDKITNSINAALIYMGMQPISIEQLKADPNNHLSVKDRFPDLFVNRWQEAGKIFYDTYFSDTAVTPLEGAEETLIRLINAGLPVTLLSNKRGAILNAEVDKLGWRKYFISIIGSTDTEYDKPHPIPALTVLKPTQVEPSSKVWFVGDAITDVECALNINSTPILFGDTITPENKPKGVLRVANHKEFQKLIANKRTFL